ncbi:MAG: TetR/AcrR family transcriptional regulator [Myxococcota bacterium]
MGREDVEALRRRIVAEATRRFADSGYRATTIQQIADAVGIGKTLVLYHYPSKEALRAEVLNAVIGAWEAFLPRLVASVGGRDVPPEEVLGSIVAFMRSHPDLPRFLLRELLDSGSDVGALLGERLGPATEAAATLVQRDGGDAHAQVILAGIVLLGVLAVFKPGPDGALQGPAGEDGGLGERVLAEAVRAVSRALG